MTLWRVSDHVKLAAVVVGPQSATDPNGYQYERTQPLVLAAGSKYRLSQQTRRGMPDKWFDGSIADAYARDNPYAHNFQGCYSERHSVFPAKLSGVHSIYGLLNFYVVKAESKGTEGKGEGTEGQAGTARKAKEKSLG